MSITIRECGHSAETNSREYVKRPDVCVSCEYLQKHPRTHVSDTPRGIANKARIVKYWQDVRNGLKPKRGARTAK